MTICLVPSFRYYIRHILCQTTMTRCHTCYTRRCNS